MAKSVNPIPDGYHTLTPYLYIRGAADAIEFYKKAFGAKELFRMPGPDGKSVGHAEIQIGDSIIMMADEMPDQGIKGPKTLNGTSASFLLYVQDVDSAFKQAVSAGATVTQPLENKFYGDRMGGVADPYGHHWYLGTHIEDLTPEEIGKRAQAEQAKAAGKK
jgi:PhnB protein